MLIVTEALTKDVGRGVARLDPGDMKKIGVKVGDLVIISGQKQSAARVMPQFSEQRHNCLLLIDGLIRENAGATVGDKVTVLPVKGKAAQHVVLQPVLDYPRINIEYIKQSLEGLPLRTGDRVRISLLGLKHQDFFVCSTAPDEIVLINKNTLIAVKESGAPSANSEMPVRYEDIGGLQKEILRIREMIELPLAFPVLFEHLGIDPPRGVLLCGPPGTGKTLIARVVASETKAHFIHINGPEIINKYYGESEAKLREIFETASRREPSIIFLDEIDALAPKRQNVAGEVEKRVVAQLLSLMDGLDDRGKVIVIGATNLPDNLDSALRRPGRFDREITIGVPDSKDRLEILQIHSRDMPLTEDVDLDTLARITNGFVGADLKAVCREAAMQALRRVFPSLVNNSGNLSPEWIKKIKVDMTDFLLALQEIQPSATRELLVEVPRVKWEDIGGLTEVKKQLQESIEWPIKYERLFKHAKIGLPKGIMLYGPPGTGKTMLARAAANEINANFISVKGPALLSKWVGESERSLRDIFKRARQVAPCVVFFDEIDAFVSHRGTGGDVAERMLSQLLTEMDGVEELHRVVVLAATNRIDMIDPALLRPGRFDLILHLELPAPEERAEILDVHLRGLPVANDISGYDFTERTAGFSGADLKNLCRKATMLALREYVEKGDFTKNELEFFVCEKHFDSALQLIKEQKSW